MNRSTSCDNHSKALLDWYADNKRDLPWRRTDDPYAIWISEVMLQQTQVKTVIAYYLRFMDLFPDVNRLAGADLQHVLKAWEGLGYYSRARHLHRAAQIVVEQMDGCVPAQWEALRSLPGIGDYIAAAVLSIAFGLPAAVLDGNVKRVLSRLYAIAAPVNQPSAHREFQSRADALLDRRDPGRFNQAMMELGALVCLPRVPLCRQCPLAPGCRALAGGTVSIYPRRTPRAAQPLRELVAAAIWKNDRLLLIQRPVQGLLGGLWELPNWIMDPTQTPEQACVKQTKAAVGLHVSAGRQLAVVRHAYTHFKIRLTVFECRWQSGSVRLNGPAAYKWIDPRQIDQYALHKAMAKVWPQVLGAGK